MGPGTSLQPRLVIAGVVALVVALAYGLVALRFGRRKLVERSSERALIAFAVWWGALALNIALGGLTYVAAGAGYTSVGVETTWAVFERLLLAVSLFGLLYYMAYVLTGREFTRTLGVFYGAYFVFLLYSMLAGTPDGVAVYTWRTDLHYATPAPPAMTAVNGVWLLLPPIAAAVGLFSLAFRVSDRTARYRSIVVSVSVVLWWVVAVVAGQRAALSDDAFQVFNRFFGLAAALAVFAAYYPPTWVQRTLHVHPYSTA
ncbi:MAG: hypothetical protein ACYDCK_14340 [Thermoplasmatota archaeon]